MKISSGFFKISSALVILFSSSVSTSAFAGNYGVQVGAFKNVPWELISRLEAFDSVTTLQGKSITSVVVGNFDSVSDARITLARLESAGYRDAFVRDLDKARALSSMQTSTNASGTPYQASGYENQRFSTSEKAKWDSLTPEQQLNAVILDGKLHLKQGDKFTPIKASW
jgi:hypothetical protein